MGESLLRFSPEDKKQIINVLLKDRIRITGNENNLWKAERPIFRFNKEILERLIEECKILENLGLVRSGSNKPSRLQKMYEQGHQYPNLLSFLVVMEEKEVGEVFIRP